MNQNQSEIRYLTPRKNTAVSRKIRLNTLIIRIPNF